jgi:hypothetical protein
MSTPRLLLSNRCRAPGQFIALGVLLSPSGSRGRTSLAVDSGAVRALLGPCLHNRVVCLCERLRSRATTWPSIGRGNGHSASTGRIYLYHGIYLLRVVNVTSVVAQLYSHIHILRSSIYVVQAGPHRTRTPRTALVTPVHHYRSRPKKEFLCTHSYTRTCMPPTRLFAHKTQDNHYCALKRQQLLYRTQLSALEPTPCPMQHLGASLSPQVTIFRDGVMARGRKSFTAASPSLRARRRVFWAASIVRRRERACSSSARS